MSSTEWTAEARQTHRTLSLQTIVGLACVGFMAVATYVLLSAMIGGQGGDAETINVSGRQRMLSQRISVMALRYATAPDAETRATAETLLRDAAALMETSHEALTHGDAEMGIPAPRSAEIRHHYFDAPVNLDAEVQAYLSSVEQLLAEPPAALGASNPILTDIVAKAQKPLLSELNAAVGIYEAESRARVAQLSRISGVITLLMLGLLGVEGWLLFRPMIRGVSDQISRIAHANAVIQAREESLRLVLDSTGDALIPIDAAGRIVDGASTRTTEWLPAAVAGAPYWEALSPDDHDTALRMEMDFEQLVDGFMPAEVTLSQMLDRLTVGDRVLSLEYRQIGDEDTPSGYLIVASDITAHLAAEQAEALAHERQVVLTRALNDREAFTNFLNEADALLRRALSPDRGQRERLRDLHTIKGNVSLYGFVRMAKAVHALEDRIRDEADLDVLAEIAALQEAWTEQVDEICAVLGAEQREGLWISEPELHQHLQALAGGEDHEVLLLRVRQWQHEPVTRRVDELGRHIERLSTKLSKDVSVVASVDPTLRLPGARFRELWNSLVHVVRNAVDHGIEDAETRTAAGKPAAGEIHLSARRQGPLFVLTISDDGGGIDFGALRSKALRNGTALPEEPSDLLWLDGLSARDEVSELSGRGVGMSAVKAAVTELGGSITVSTSRGMGTQFHFHIPVSLSEQAGTDADEGAAVA